MFQFFSVMMPNLAPWIYQIHKIKFSLQLEENYYNSQYRQIKYNKIKKNLLRSINIVLVKIYHFLWNNSPQFQGNYLY